MTGNTEPAAAAGRLGIGDGPSVNRIGFGAMQLPGPMVWGPPADHDTAMTVLQRAIELGVDHIDTSDAYGPHVANDLIREALSPYQDDLLIATKVGVQRDESKAFSAVGAADVLIAQVEENLNRLGLSRLALVYLRVGGDGLMPPAPEPFPESLGALVRLREQGLVDNIGLSGVTAEQLEQAMSITPIAAVQNRLHLLDRSATDVLQVCERHGIAFTPYFPLAAGMLGADVDAAEVPPAFRLTHKQRRTLDEIAGRHFATRSQIALAWLLAISPVTLLIPGTSSPAHVEQNVAAGEISLTQNDLDALAHLPA